MAKRYIPNAPFATADKKGRRRLFVPDFKQKDGTQGYTEDDLKLLPKETLNSFRLIEVSGDSVTEVEAATAAPGEKRAAKPKSSK